MGWEKPHCEQPSWGRSQHIYLLHQQYLPREKEDTLTSPFAPAIISADHFSRSFEKAQHPEEQFEDSAAKRAAERRAQQSRYERFMEFGKENRYKIVGVSWVASMAVALTIVGKSPYLSTAQKLVQARVYAQGLTLAVLVATAVFEIGDRNNEEGRWETVKYADPNDPEHKRLLEKKVHHERYAGEDQWRGEFFGCPTEGRRVCLEVSLTLWCTDMIAAEEDRERERAEAIREQEEKHRKAGKVHHKKKKPQQHEDDHHKDELAKEAAKEDTGAQDEGKKEGKK
ncbi:MAG: hypothetical protein Q9207_006770 [Kuettlingeria erythrocarpa]